MSTIECEEKEKGQTRHERDGYPGVIGWIIVVDWDDSIYYVNSYGATRTLLSEDSKSLAMSCSEGKPPAVTSEANVNVQYDSILFVGAAMVVVVVVVQDDGEKPKSCGKDSRETDDVGGHNNIDHGR